MIENDKIVLAELASLLAAGHILNDEQELLLSGLLIQYPEARTYLRNVIESGRIETPIDLLKLEIDKEWSVFQSRVVAQNVPVVKYNWIRWGTVAALLIAVSVIGVLWFAKSDKPAYIVEDTVYGQKNDILPTDAQARFEVDDKFVKQLGIEDVGKSPGTANTNNRRYRIITPIRSSYSLKLSDGTKVWLSPESKVEYLSAFSKTERRVKVKGEAFFEVAKDAAKPFIVEVDGLEIKALGTAFSIRNYTEDAPQVVLTEGRLQLNTQTAQAVLEAGYQAGIVNGTLKAEESTLLEDALAIKDGFFNFNNKDIKTILREINRWYGVKLQVDRTLDTKKYTGSIERNVTLAKVCSVLKDLTGYQYLIEEDRLIVK
ncbi:FecR family protein [Sphingobacterium yanglingense]|uniref:FecR family protein n=1 Tax=Sphingobacterium yanglingense TaxID=1437280 RepID=A0A4R6W8P5_9SPHI|nr:FecR domain-containing protein [Sphingobacterium yanglingense]TDQ75416.1 FecR family protein [Sphingobacterium yanglingense]TDQ75419.1 FecR family protein [Sphingobacterium yanglingense]